MRFEINKKEKGRGKNLLNLSFLKRAPKKSEGYTFVELIVVIAILGILMAIIIPSFAGFRQSSALNGDTMNLITLINRARLLSVADKGDVQYGIHLEAGKVVLYQGSTYSSGASTNESYPFSSGITLSNLVINGGGSEILFAKVTGATTQAATMTLLSAGNSASTTIAVLPVGVATIQ